VTPTGSGTDEEGLVRSIGPIALTASLVNVIIGGGIFAIPATVAAEVGAAAPLAYIVGGAAILLVAIALATTGRRVDRSGGPYAYVKAVLGPFAGFLTGTLTWLVGVFASAALLTAATGIVGSSDPALQTGWARQVLIVVLYAIPVAINLMAMRLGSRFVVGLTVIKLTTLALFLLVVLPHMNPGAPSSGEPVSIARFGRGVILTFFAFGGMEVALGTSGEVRSPARTVPVALLTSTAIVVALYALIQVAAQGALGAGLAASTAPLADAVATIDPRLRIFLTVGAAVSIMGAMVGTLLGSARILFAIGRDGVLPLVIARVHGRSHIPHVAVLVHAVIACVLALTGTFASLAILTSASGALVYLLCCVAALVLIRRGAPGEKGSNSLWIQASAGAGVIVLGLLIATLSVEEIAAVFAVVIAASALYGLRRLRLKATG
jgi:APA family basic amino acid/polyamine antiporter